jgi:hypothetical protein
LKKSLLLGAAVLGGACGHDIGTGPGAVSSLVPITAQCVASDPGLTARGASIVQSRLASVLASGRAARGGSPDALVCLSRDGARWRVGPVSAGADP